MTSRRTTEGRRYSLADLYLAFRHAKTALFYERRGVGLLEFAAFEENLDANLRALRVRLARNGGWFDGIPIGEVWITPKKLAPAKWDDADDVIRIGAPIDGEGPDLDVQLRFSPTPEFAIVEVLFLWEFGLALESVLSSSAIGYRLHERHGRIQKDGRWLFQFWPTQYKLFRAAPVEAARRMLADEEATTILSVDLASFYDTVDPAFLLAPGFASDVFTCASRRGYEFDRREYRHAVRSLLGAYSLYRTRAARRTGLPWERGLPIGALTSRVVANVALATLDREIESASRTICYRRYVDDIVVVCRIKGKRPKDATAVLKTVFPMLSEDGESLILDADALGRPGSQFQVQRRKLRVHHLMGLPGLHFLRAVQKDFNKLASERRAFLDESTILDEAAAHLTRAGRADGSPLRVLRDADRVRLEHFALSTSLASLERVSCLVDKVEARDLARQTQRRIGRVLDAEEDWVTSLDLTLRLLQLAISTDDRMSFVALMRRTDSIWSTTTNLTKNVRTLRHMGRELPKGRGWSWLRNYLHERRLEAIAQSIGEDCPRIVAQTQRLGITHRAGAVHGTVLLKYAHKLSNADLRSRDREDDHIARVGRRRHGDARLAASLARDEILGARLQRVDRFVRLCRRLRDKPWALEPWRLFLCTRPPSYLDIARRMLAQVESKGFDEFAFEQILGVVNAVRGTSYVDPMGTVIDSGTVRLGPAAVPSAPPILVADPRIILGNLVASPSDWLGAATWVAGSIEGRPTLSLGRLRGLATVLRRARFAARIRNAGGRHHALLVLPELAVPRRWFRMIANHVAKFPGLALVMGLEYRHVPQRREVLNQVFTVLPGGLNAAVAWSWTKRRPAREEEVQLAQRSLSFPTPPSFRTRTVVSSVYGNFSVLICSELIEARRVADLLGRVDLVLVPSWNSDTASYDHLVQSVSLQLHAITAVANNGHYSDCRAWAPLSERWQRDLCRIVQRDINDVVSVNIPLAELRRIHAGSPSPVLTRGPRPTWFPLPPEWP